MAKEDNSGKQKRAVGGFAGRSIGGKFDNCHFEGKIIINGNPEDVDVGGFVGQQENTEIVNSSADAKIEFANETKLSEEILLLNPNLHGIGINLHAVFKRVRTFFCRGSHLK